MGDRASPLLFTVNSQRQSPVFVAEAAGALEVLEVLVSARGALRKGTDTDVVTVRQVSEGGRPSCVTLLSALQAKRLCSTLSQRRWRAGKK